MNKRSHAIIVLTTVCALVLLCATIATGASAAASRPVAVKPSVARQHNQTNSVDSRQQPLANLDKVLKQASEVKVDAIADPKLTANLTNMFSEMANNMRKMLMENKRLQVQVQETLARVQNTTGFNATALQQQAMATALNQNETRARINSMLSIADTSGLSKQLTNMSG